jgi:hypothetical protein
VYEVRIGAYRIYLYAERFKMRIFFSEVNKLGWANKSKIGRIEKEHSPFA